MELQMISLQIPQVVMDVYDKLCSLLSPNKQAAIAGGCLSDLYMGCDFKDVDIFLDDESLTTQQLTSLFGEKIHDYSVISGEGDYATLKYKLYKGMIKGIRYDFVFVKNMDRIYDFDMRFRQFYYINGTCLVNPDALEDINKKKMVLVNLHSSYSVLARIKMFSDRYGFSLTRKSRDYLGWYLNRRSYSHNSVISYILEGNNKLQPNQKRELVRTLENKKRGNHLFFEDTSFPFHPALEEGLYNWLREDPTKSDSSGLVGRFFTKIENYRFPIQNPFPFSFTLQREDIESAILSTIHRCEKVFQKYSLKASLNPKLDHTMMILEPMFDRKVPNNAKISLFQTTASHFSRFARQMNISEHLSDRAFHVPQEGVSYEVTFSYDTDPTRFTDLLCQHTFIIKVKRGTDLLKCLFRKTESGRFTLSAILEDSTLSNVAWVLAPALNKHLIKQHPEMFVFDTEDIRVVIQKDAINQKTKELFFQEISFDEMERSNLA